MLGAVEVAVVDVALEVAFESGEAHVQVAGEGGTPALFEDQPVQRLDGTVRLGSAGADERVPRVELLEGGAEVGGAKLAPVIGEDAGVLRCC